jgi:hypothetical protein
MLDDANRFAIRNRYIIDEASLQIYMSAVLFAPSSSSVRRMFGDDLRRYFNVMPRVTDRWGAEKQKLEGHDSYVSAVAFGRHNGSATDLGFYEELLVQASSAKEVRIISTR